jgi:hypothetical protein
MRLSDDLWTAPAPATTTPQVTAAIHDFAGSLPLDRGPKVPFGPGFAYGAT